MLILKELLNTLSANIMQCVKVWSQRYMANIRKTSVRSALLVCSFSVSSDSVCSTTTEGAMMLSSNQQLTTYQACPDKTLTSVILYVRNSVLIFDWTSLKVAYSKSQSVNMIPECQYQSINSLLEGISMFFNKIFSFIWRKRNFCI